VISRIEAWHRGQALPLRLFEGSDITHPNSLFFLSRQRANDLTVSSDTDFPRPGFFARQKCTSCGARLRTSHVSVEPSSLDSVSGAHDRKAETASRQEGATAEKAVPFSKPRLSIVIHTRPDDDTDPADRGHDSSCLQLLTHA
jgi:hypothetical protein